MRGVAFAGLTVLALLAPSIAAAQESSLVDALMRSQPAGNRLVLGQTPPSPVRVGTKGIRFNVTSRQTGFVALLDIAQDFSVTLLYPNQFTAVASPDGPVRAGQTIIVPDDAYFGGRVPENAGFGAPEVTSGRIMAIFSEKPPNYPPGFAAARGLRPDPQGRALIEQVASAFGISVTPPRPPGLPPIFTDPPYLVGDFMPAPPTAVGPRLSLPDGVAIQFMPFEVR